MVGSEKTYKKGANALIEKIPGWTDPGPDDVTTTVCCDANVARLRNHPSITSCSGQFGGLRFFGDGPSTKPATLHNATSQTSTKCLMQTGSSSSSRKDARWQQQLEEEAAAAMEPSSGSSNDETFDEKDVETGDEGETDEENTDIEELSVPQLELEIGEQQKKLRKLIDIAKAELECGEITSEDATRRAQQIKRAKKRLEAMKDLEEERVQRSIQREERRSEETWANIEERMAQDQEVRKWNDAKRRAARSCLQPSGEKKMPTKKPLQQKPLLQPTTKARPAEKSEENPPADQKAERAMETRRCSPLGTVV